MCGISGFLKLENIKTVNLDRDDLLEMSRSLSHRGPDNNEIWTENNIYLGHTRLSILDLTENGNQPMLSRSQRFVITFNGEIYNYNELKKNILHENFSYRGNSDTEVFIECVEQIGLEQTLFLTRGMFAFAIWDRRDKELVLGRDRIGEKPIYYGYVKNYFIFSSELKAIKSLKKLDLEISKDAMNLMLRFGYVPAPNSIYKDIFKLNPGHLLKVKIDGVRQNPFIWWNNEIKKQKNTISSDINLEIDLQKILQEAVKEQMISDVPIGAFLSGGIDSSLIVSLMQEQASKPINTFTIGFTEANYNEAHYAKKVSKILGTHHHELYVSPKEAMGLIPNIPSIYDEPFGDSSQIPTLLISKLASKHVKVCLTGDGGDELFGGYNRYIWANQIYSLLKFFPKKIRRLLSVACYLLPSNDWNRLCDVLFKILPAKLKLNNVGDKIHKFGEILDFSNEKDLYFKLISQWRAEIPTAHEFDTNNFFTNNNNWNDDLSYIQNMMITDASTYLPDDILVKVDRAAMSFSLETRVPFLDKRVIEMASNIPLNSMIHDKKGKLPLRNILKKYIPDELVDRPKQGFGIPIDSWLRGPLRGWAESLLDKKKLEDSLYFDSSLIRKKWDEHLSQKHNWHSPLWNVLMLQAWLENN